MEGYVVNSSPNWVHAMKRHIGPGVLYRGYTLQIRLFLKDAAKFPESYPQLEPESHVCESNYKAVVQAKRRRHSNLIQRPYSDIGR